MAKMTIFDPAMCCSTGVCGPSLDPELLRVATILNNLENNGIKVERYNLTSHPQAFVENRTINEILNKDGVDVLPVTLVDGKIVKMKTYPTNTEFAQYLNVSENILNAGTQSSSKGCCCDGGCC